MLGMVAARRGSPAIEVTVHDAGLPGAGRSSHAFRSYVRHRCRCCVGAWVTLTVNKLWAVYAVPFGLMNGARGRAIGLVEVGPAGSDDLAFVF